MKNKHHGLAAIIISGLSLVGMLTYGFYFAGRIEGSIHIPGPPSGEAINVPDERTMAYIDFLASNLEDLAASNPKNLNVDLKLFGVNPSLLQEEKVSALATSTDDATPLQEDIVTFSYVLTLCFASLKNSFCVIDQKLYQPNSILPDGGKILKIENDRVFILRHNKKEWIYPLQQRGIPKEKNEETI